jgi:hypothetical protein
MCAHSCCVCCFSSLTGIERAFIGLVAFCLILTISLCAYLFHHRANQIWQAAGVGFYMLMGCGCMLSYLAVLSWPIENDETSCGFRIWIWTAGFHAFVAPMVACAFRIARIYTQGLQSVRVSNQQVAGYCLLLYAPQLLLNILWTSISPIRPVIVQVDLLRPKFDYTICSNDHPYGNVLFGTLTLIYSGVLLLSACYLAWRVRQAYSIFNDAKPIALSMYIFTMSSVIILVVQLSLDTPELASQKVLFGLRSAGVLLAYQSSLAILFLRRILDQIDMGPIGGGMQTAIGRWRRHTHTIAAFLFDRDAHPFSRFSHSLSLSLSRHRSELQRRQSSPEVRDQRGCLAQRSEAARGRTLPTGHRCSRQ